jgi:serine/threonine-protein kinase
VALAAATLFGAAGFGYTLGPENLQKQMDNIVSWLDKNNPFPDAGGNQMSGMGGEATDPFLSAFVPDTMTAPADSQVVAVDKGANTTKEPLPVASAVDTTVQTSAAAATELPSESNVTTMAQQTSPPAPEKNDDPQPAKTEQPAKAKKGWLSITAQPWAEIYIDGAYRGDTPPALRVELTRGAHRLECRNPGFVSYGETVHITAGELSRRRVMLKKLMGYVSISTMAGAEVYVDGTLVGVTPLGKPVELEVGAHQVTVKKAGFNVWNNQITVDAEQLLPVKITLSPNY